MSWSFSFLFLAPCNCPSKIFFYKHLEGFGEIKKTKRLLDDLEIVKEVVCVSLQLLLFTVFRIAVQTHINTADILDNESF